MSGSGDPRTGVPSLNPPPIPPRRTLMGQQQTPQAPPRHNRGSLPAAIPAGSNGASGDAGLSSAGGTGTNSSSTAQKNPVMGNAPRITSFDSFFSDMEGIDFSYPAAFQDNNSYGDQKHKKVYPDIRHAFREVAGPPDGSFFSQTLPQFGSNNSAAPMPNLPPKTKGPSSAFSALGPTVPASIPAPIAQPPQAANTSQAPQAPQQYGWNASLFANDPFFNNNNSRSAMPPKCPSPLPGAVGGGFGQPPAAMYGAPGNPFRSNMDFSVWDTNFLFPEFPGSGVAAGNAGTLGFGDESAWIVPSSQPETTVQEAAGAEGGNDDLIKLGAAMAEHEYLSLDYFDPLYARARKESVSAGSQDRSLNYSFGDPFPGIEEATPPGNTEVHSGSAAPPCAESSPNAPIGFESFLFGQDDQPPLETVVPVDAQRSEATSKPDRPPPMDTQKSLTASREKLRKRLFVDEESEAFCQMVAELKCKYKSTDETDNVGFILAPLRNCGKLSISVKVVVYSQGSAEPAIFTCDTETMVEHMISQVLYNGATSTPSRWTAADYVLKVYERAEYVISNLPLHRIEYVHDCLKLDQDIKFEMVHREEVMRPFLRTVDDDLQMLCFPKEYIKTEHAVQKQNLDILMETFYSEVEKLNNQILQGMKGVAELRGVQQAVKALCTTLAQIETIDITKSLARVKKLVEDLSKPGSRAGSLVVDADEDTMDAINMALKNSMVEEVETALEDLVKAAKQLIRMYCFCFHTDFMLGPTISVPTDPQEIFAIKETLIVHMGSIHRIPSAWATQYETYKVVCSLYHGTRRLAPDVGTTAHPLSTSLCERVIWDEWLQFEGTELSHLPRETRLCMTLCGLKTAQNSGSNSSASPSTKVTMPLGGATIQLYSQRGHLVQGSQLLPLQMGKPADPFMPSCKTLLSDSTLLQVNLQDFCRTVYFPPPTPDKSRPAQKFENLSPGIRDTIHTVLDKEKSSFGADEMETLWSYRYYLTEHPALLPRVLAAVPSWHWVCLGEIYSLLQAWQPLQPMEAFELLLPQYPDLEVREFAVKSLSEIPTDDLVHFLPQLIQGLKFESYHSSSLARLLLEQSCKSIRFAHQFFWLLKGVAAQDMSFKRRYELMFVALANVAGHALYQEFRKQEEFVKLVSATAEKVQTAKDRDNVLRRDLQAIYELFEEKHRILMPFNPSIDVCGIDVKSCSYFTSNAFPLKLVLKNSNPRADPVYVMYKVGDDLRQDMLTLQMVRIMDNLWLQDGLDLKIITFDCLATGPKRGIIELVTESETLRKIQVISGVTGSFKDHTIKEWLRRHNPTELEYQKAVENFTSSCAGYCVATYVLGIGDRHNDNIMLKQSGHMFHIDFSRFLGDAQMFYTFKRDRVPFVLTSDMAYVINDGGKQTQRFQHFIDLCCQAFNILRQHAALFQSLFVLMARSGIPGVTEQAAKYIEKALLPGLTEVQATAVFTKMINESLSSTFTQFNFFLHNLAQMKFSGHNEGSLLSFVPKTFSMQTDGKIKSVKLMMMQKRYSPEKRYVYILKIEREEQRVPSFIIRTFQEFVEFRDKMASTFPLVTFPSIGNRMVLGRSNVRTVAEARKVEIENFLEKLQHMAPEIRECDLVYTFFHTLLQDETDTAAHKLELKKLREPNRPPPPASKEPVIAVTTGRDAGIKGEIKLSLQYKRDTLNIMVAHVRDLACVGSEQPSPYVKTYLLPDPEKQTKRKTKAIKNTTHPTYNEVLEYQMPLDELRFRVLQVTVWHYDVLGENSFLGAVYINLRDHDLVKGVTSWYKLQKLQMTDGAR